MFDVRELRLPVVQAPMAGGPSTPELVAAVAGAGGLGFLAAGYRTADEVADLIGRVRARTTEAFGVNVFVPRPVPDPAGAARYRAELAAEAERYGVPLPEPDPADTDDWDAKVRLLTDDPVPVVSFTFGPPPAPVVAALRAAGTCVVVTVTTAAEAREAAALGVAALCVQGPEAGGHRGTFAPAADPGPAPLPALLAAVGAATGLPLIAAGGITTGTGAAAALRAGAVAVQSGTGYLLSPEAGTAPAYRAALTDPAFGSTAVTRAFTGRPARGLRNRFIDEHDASAPAAYPLLHHLTRPLRAAAAAAGDPHGMSLWAGTGHRDARPEPAAEVTRRLAGG
ncbi:nitronate monooxygenase [Streptomyces litchfieldiae]|uniref:nitronate monooxygenase n=1 Tax=Streptomyces litchfieldiae TaxID=3075543 RepID=UPI00374E0106